MKILFVNTYGGFWGGVERYIYDCAKAFKAHGWSCYGLFESMGKETRDFETVFEKCWVDEPNQRVALIQKIKEQGITIAFVHKSNSPELLHQLNISFNTTCLVHDHDYYCIRKHKYFPLSRKNCQRPLARLFCTLCSGVIERKPGAHSLQLIDIGRRFEIFKQIRKMKTWIVLSEYMKSNLVLNGFPASQIQIIHPFKELPPESAKKIHDPVTILYSGQIIRGKGVDLLIQSLVNVRGNYLCRIMGKGNDEDYIRGLMKEYKLESKVQWIGWTNEVDKYYREADILAVPSRWQEPFGLIGIEAFSRGIPVVGFNVGGIHEWLKDGVNGYCVPAGDTVEFARKLSSLIEDPELRLHMGQAGYRLVQQEYNQKILLERYEGLFASYGI